MNEPSPADPFQDVLDHMMQISGISTLDNIEETTVSLVF
jgi:hypothetical protein